LKPVVPSTFPVGCGSQWKKYELMQRIMVATSRATQFSAAIVSGSSSGVPVEFILFGFAMEVFDLEEQIFF